MSLSKAIAALLLTATPALADGGGPNAGHGSSGGAAAFYSRVYSTSPSLGYYAMRQPDFAYYYNRQGRRIIFRSQMTPGGRFRESGGLCGGCTAPSGYDYNRN